MNSDINSMIEYRDSFSKIYLSSNFELQNSDCCSTVSKVGYCNHADVENRQQSMQQSSCPSCLESIFDHENSQQIENSCKLLSRIAGLHQNPELSDIQIVVGLKIFYAHKLILCSASEVFRVMFTHPSWCESSRQKIVLKEEPECIQVFELFLRYLYTGKIRLTHYTVLYVLMLADKYGVEDLQEVCMDYMCSHLVSTVQHNHTMTWLQYGYISGHKRLTTECYQFILWNFHKILSTLDFLTTDKDILISFINQSELVVPDEYVLFKGITRWIDYQMNHFNDRSSDINNVALEVLSYIRFPLMMPAHLNMISTDSIAAYFKDFISERVTASMLYHSSVEETRRNMARFSGETDHFVPRNYTNEMWSTTLSIDHFSNLASHEVRPIFFSTPISAAQLDESVAWEWNVDLYPKGIHFQKCVMIGLWRNMEISGAVYNTVRLVLATKMGEKRDVKVSVLVSGLQDGVEYIKRVVHQVCMFDEETKICHINDIVPFNELNSPNSTYLCGPETNSFKITIVIKPNAL